MGRKKKDQSYLKPFCYYCDKICNNEIILHQHQKAKHFTCQTCHKKFSTASSMCSHITSVHKENILKVPNAIPGRDSVELNIFGMQGVPKPLIDERVMAGAAAYWQKVKSAQQQQLITQQKKEKAAAKKEMKIIKPRAVDFMDNSKKQQQQLQQQAVQQVQKPLPQREASGPISFNLNMNIEKPSEEQQQQNTEKTEEQQPSGFNKNIFEN